MIREAADDRKAGAPRALSYARRVVTRLTATDLADAYEARPPYQRNDYLGWIGQAKQEETREKRIAQMIDELRRGDVYMNMVWRGKRRGQAPRGG